MPRICETGHARIITFTYRRLRWLGARRGAFQCLDCGDVSIDPAWQPASRARWVWRRCRRTVFRIGLTAAIVASAAASGMGASSR